MTVASYPDPHSHPASWCAVWTRLGGTWRIEADGSVRLLLSFDGWIGGDPRPEAMMEASGADGLRAVEDHINWTERRKHHAWS